MVSGRNVNAAIAGMVSVYMSPYKHILYSQKHQLLYQEWTPESLKLGFETFMQEASAFQEAIMQYKPKLLLINQEDFAYRLTDEHNDWYLRHLSPVLQEVRPKRSALVVNEDLLNQLKMEQLAEAMQEYFTSFKIEYLFFENNQKALEWLIAP